MPLSLKGNGNEERLSGRFNAEERDRYACLLRNTKQTEHIGCTYEFRRRKTLWRPQETEQHGVKSKKRGRLIWTGKKRVLILREGSIILYLISGRIKKNRGSRKDG
ncbi:hypothetical protein TWF173_010545 [Orbilia oligospora]|jgi:hypothetical protein|uniref:Uncharacterized protein n=1 Tax=Orbilia oligospora TaxID=2813651 RepID=A0A7C8VPI0_ORBOL|nr:hypothetical protein TWF970_000403 [Orbilia oligospora]KAF3309839.1 hypothetical protein TWF173_010545 [Orbilia oligospora]